MKAISSILFILILLITGCNSNSSKPTEQSATAKGKGGLHDSIHDPSLTKLVLTDSIELLAVAHTISDTYHVEQILYLDHHAYKSDFADDWRFMKELPAKLPTLKKDLNNFPDSMPRIPNPFPEINGAYKPVVMYKGQYCMLGTDASFTQVITDSGLIHISMMMALFPIVKAEKAGHTTRYITANVQGDIDTLEIKKLNDGSDIQIWKETGPGLADCHLMVPLHKTFAMPEIATMNNLGSGVDMQIPADKINLDSLFQLK